MSRNFYPREKMNRKLERQCQEHDIPLEYIQVQRGVDEQTQIKRPEDLMLRMLRADGFQGTARELHPVTMLLQAGCADHLEKGAKKIICEDYRARSFHVQIGMYCLDQKTIVNAIKGKSRAELLSAWEYIYSNDQIQQWFPGIERDDIAAVFDGLGMERLLQIAEMIFDNPEDHANGWPDVFAYDGRKMILIEVKTKDALRESQIYTWKNLLPQIGLEAKVVCLERV